MFIFSAEVKAESYVCFDENKDKSVRFFWNNLKVSRDHFSFYYENAVVSNYADPLEGYMKGGTYNIKKTAQKITLSYIQDTVRSKIALPSKEFVDETDPKGWDALYQGQHQYIYRYHATFPAVQTYAFDKTKKQLLSRKDYRFLPREAIKIKFSVHPDGKASPDEKMILSQEEKEQIFATERSLVFSRLYPHCEELGFFKRLLNNIFEILFFA